MGDDIRISVGVKSNVKQGMDQVVNDIDNGTKKIPQKLERAMSGKGFMEVFMKAVRGDISGAIEDLGERMGTGFNGIIAKAAVWGSGIATALFAGFKAGEQLDKTFGISDKLSKLFVQKESTGLDPETKRLRAQRQEREKADADEIKAYKEKIAKENEMLEDQTKKIKDEMEDRRREGKMFADQIENMGTTADIISKLAGRGDMTGEQEVQRQYRMALDRDFRKSEIRQEREVARERRRRDMLLDQAGKIVKEEGAGALQRNPKLKRLWDAEQKRIELANAQENIRNREKMAWEAQINSEINTRAIAANTAEMNKMLIKNLQLK